MSNEAFRDQKLTSHEYYQARRWEGKPFRYKFKFMVANYPEMGLMGLCGIIGPIIAYWGYLNYPGSKRDALIKFKPTYTVVRDNDPNLEAIIKEKEMNRECFP